MSLLQALLIALIEGLTEFLPISSTGHMILASAAMDLHDDEFVKTFEVGIQLGAILAIVMLYAQRFLQGFTIYYKLSLAFLPSALVGFFAYDFIKNYFDPWRSNSDFNRSERNKEKQQAGRPFSHFLPKCFLDRCGSVFFDDSGNLPGCCNHRGRRI